MSLFSVSFRKQVKDFLAPVIRGEYWIDFIYYLIKPLQTAINDNVNFEEEQERRAKYNGQKMIVQTALNEIMSVTSAPFILVETRQSFLNIAPVFYNEPEPEITGVTGNESENTITTLNNSEETAFAEDVVVKIPVGLSTTSFDANVEAEFLKYKVTGVTYRIETY
jgi:hypothetical protein